MNGVRMHAQETSLALWGAPMLVLSQFPFCIHQVRFAYSPGQVDPTAELWRQVPHCSNCVNSKAVLGERLNSGIKKIRMK